jgi:hypothetical protein
MRKAVLATVTVGLILGGTGMAVAGESGVGRTVAAGDAGCAAGAAPTMLTSAQATDAALRGAGGGRVAGVVLAEKGGQALYSVRFVRGNQVRTAVVDAFTGEVTSIVGGAAGGIGSGTGGSSDDDSDDDDSDDDDSDDDDSDDDDSDDDDDGDDDGGPIREGVEANK